MVQVDFQPVEKVILMPATTLAFPDEPRLVRLCREIWDPATCAETGKTIIAWALAVPDGPAVTVEPYPSLRPGGAPTSHRVTVWPDLPEAVHTLDTFIDGPHNPFPLTPGPS